MPRKVPKRLVNGSQVASKGSTAVSDRSPRVQKALDLGPDLNLNAVIVEIDLEKLVLELQDSGRKSSRAEQLANGSEVPRIERRQATRLSKSEVGDDVQVSLPRAARTTLVNVSDSGVLVETNCQLFPGRTTDVFVKLLGERQALRATVVRSSLHSLTSEGLVYRSALHFERIIGLAERLAR